MTTTRDGQSVACCVRIGRRDIGPGAATYLVAEAGVNHNGSLDTALRMIDAAADAGADAVKFQVFRAEDLTTAAAGLAAYQTRCGSRSQRDMLADLELSDHDFARLKEHCDQLGVQFLATPFSPGDVDRLMELGVPAIKIASTDIDNPLLLEYAAQTRLPLIISTGTATEAEIRAAINRLLEGHIEHRLVLLHCVSSYPTPIEAANLRAIRTLERLFGLPAGYSDHTRSTEIGAWAVAAGARLLEKHFTLDRTATGPDHAVSLEPAELAAYFQAVRRVEQALGSGRLDMCALEADVRAVARKSVVARHDIPAGTTLVLDLLTVKRPGGGIPPDQLEHLIGRRTRIDVPRDTVITWDMLQ